MPAHRGKAGLATSGPSRPALRFVQSLNSGEIVFLALPSPACEVAFPGATAKETQHDKDLGDGSGGNWGAGCGRPRGEGGGAGGGERGREKSRGQKNERRRQSTSGKT